MVMLNNFLVSPLFFISLLIGITAISFIVTFIVYLLPKFKKQFFKMPRILPKIGGISFILIPLCILPLISQPRFSSELAWIFLLIGIILVLGGVIIGGLAFRQIGIFPSLIPEAEKPKKVIDRGIYGKIRHPIYLSSILFALGLAIIFRAKYALMYAPFITILFIIMVWLEEKDMVKYYGKQYIKYKKKVPWRFIPRLF